MREWVWEGKSGGEDLEKAAVGVQARDESTGEAGGDVHSTQEQKGTGAGLGGGWMWGGGRQRV